MLKKENLIIMPFSLAKLPALGCPLLLKMQHLQSYILVAILQKWNVKLEDITDSTRQNIVVIAIASKLVI